VCLLTAEGLLSWKQTQSHASGWGGDFPPLPLGFQKQVSSGRRTHSLLVSLPSAPRRSANTPGVLSRGLETLISEVSEPFIRDQTSRITPASVSSRGAPCSERLSSKPRGRTHLKAYIHNTQWYSKMYYCACCVCLFFL
jgi:hypothetical protein